eukprot:COSAG02_NODE_2012_length_10118_cov_7.152111_4_plen_77_part_00
MYIEKDSVRFFFLPAEAAFFLDGFFFGGIVKRFGGFSGMKCSVGGLVDQRALVCPPPAENEYQDSKFHQNSTINFF